jgi:hypothetical protein
MAVYDVLRDQLAANQAIRAAQEEAQLLGTFAPGRLRAERESEQLDKARRYTAGESLKAKREKNRQTSLEAQQRSSGADVFDLAPPDSLEGSHGLRIQGALDGSSGLRLQGGTVADVLGSAMSGGPRQIAAATNGGAAAQRGQGGGGAVGGGAVGGDSRVGDFLQTTGPGSLQPGDPGTLTLEETSVQPAGDFFGGGLPAGFLNMLTRYAGINEKLSTTTRTTRTVLDEDAIASAAGLLSTALLDYEANVTTKDQFAKGNIKLGDTNAARNLRDAYSEVAKLGPNAPRAIVRAKLQMNATKLARVERYQERAQDLAVSLVNTGVPSPMIQKAIKAQLNGDVAGFVAALAPHSDAIAQYESRFRARQEERQSLEIRQIQLANRQAAAGAEMAELQLGMFKQRFLDSENFALRAFPGLERSSNVAPSEMLGQLASLLDADGEFTATGSAVAGVVAGQYMQQQDGKVFIAPKAWDDQPFSLLSRGEVVGFRTYNMHDVVNAVHTLLTRPVTMGDTPGSVDDAQRNALGLLDEIGLDLGVKRDQTGEIVDFRFPGGSNTADSLLSGRMWSPDSPWRDIYRGLISQVAHGANVETQIGRGSWVRREAEPSAPVQGEQVVNQSLVRRFGREAGMDLTRKGGVVARDLIRKGGILLGGAAEFGGGVLEGAQEELAKPQGAQPGAR